MLIPKFDGDQFNWESFKELFTATMAAGPRATDIIKLQHLLNNVEGPAAKEPKGTKVIGANYQVAWKKSECRYGNKKARLHTHFESMINLPKAPQKSAAQLSNLVDKIEETVKGIKELELTELVNCYDR